jgi:hypothetical protein
MGYSGSYDFSLSPDELWSAIERTDRFSDWWIWLKDFHLTGDGLVPGSVLYGVVDPPVPYRMRISVEILRVSTGAEIDAGVHGDLEGAARLRLGRSGDGCRVEVDWEVEMMQTPMRLASRFAYPLLRFGHDRVVEATIASFRRHVEPVRS